MKDPHLKSPSASVVVRLGPPPRTATAPAGHRSCYLLNNPLVSVGPPDPFPRGIWVSDSTVPISSTKGGSYMRLSFSSPSVPGSRIARHSVTSNHPPAAHRP